MPCLHYLCRHLCDLGPPCLNLDYGHTVTQWVAEMAMWLYTWHLTGRMCCEGDRCASGLGCRRSTCQVMPSPPPSNITGLPTVNGTVTGGNDTRHDGGETEGPEHGNENESERG